MPMCTILRASVTRNPTSTRLEHVVLPLSKAIETASAVDDKRTVLVMSI